MTHPTTARARRRRARAALAVGAAVLFGSAQPSMADPFGQGSASTQRRADDMYEEYCFVGSNWNDQLRAYVHAAMGVLADQTDMQSFFKNPCTQGVDIRWYLGESTTTTTRSVVTCVTRVPGGQSCDTYRADLHLFAIGGAMPPGHAPDALAKNLSKESCHIIGVATGLHAGKDTDDCMWPGDVSKKSETSDQWQRFNQHHIDHVNSRVITSF